MTDAKKSKPTAKAAADDLRSRLGEALAKSQPPPAVAPPAQQPAMPTQTPASTNPVTSPAAPAPRETTARVRLSSISVPVSDLSRTDEIAAWLQKETGERGIGASSVVRALLRSAKLDPALVEAFQTLRAEDGRRRR